MVPAAKVTSQYWPVPCIVIIGMDASNKLPITEYTNDHEKIYINENIISKPARKNMNGWVFASCSFHSQKPSTSHTLCAQIFNG